MCAAGLVMASTLPPQWSGLKLSTFTNSDGNRNVGHDHMAQLCYCFAMYTTLVKLQLKGLEYRSNKLVALYNLNAIYMLYILQPYIVFNHTYVKS